MYDPGFLLQAAQEKLGLDKEAAEIEIDIKSHST